MKRRILAFIAAILAWAAAATVINRLLRLVLTGYAVAEPSFAFTLGMLWARLALGAVSSLVAGAIVARLAPASPRLPLALGALLLLLFLPVHYGLWANFPPWYHILFLGSLLPFVVLGARLGATRKD